MLILNALHLLIPAFQARAITLDSQAAFPLENIRDLARIGALMAPLPPAQGGLGWGSEAAGAAGCMAMLRLIGQGSLATGRLIEGHVNAIALVVRYGSKAQITKVAAIAAAGRLLGLWVTDGPDDVRWSCGVLQGQKQFCSGAGFVDDALITIRPAEGDALMALVSITNEGARATPSAMRLQGMRAAVTGAVDFSGMQLVTADLVGAPGDYLRQPMFSAGAWRTSAVTLGGIEAMVAIAQAELANRGRAGSPHQLARMGQALIAQETARQFVARACECAESGCEPAGTISAFVNLSRIAVEEAALRVLQLVQRGLGLSAFMAGHPAEAIMRDLATYLRQPAPDETLCEAAAWFADHGMPA